MNMELCLQWVLSKSAPQKKKINRQKQSDTNKNKNDQQIKSIKYMYIYAKTQPLEYGEASLILYDHLNFIY